MNTFWAPTRIRLCERCQGTGEETFFATGRRGESVRYRTCPFCSGRGARCVLVETTDESEYNLACIEWHQLADGLAEEQAARRRLRLQTREAERRRVAEAYREREPERRATRDRITRALAARGIR